MIFEASSYADALAWVQNDPMIRDGLVDWQAIPDDHVRGRTAYIFKSVLKHAGIVRNTGLGASSPKQNKPRRNVWSLAPTFR